MKELVKENMKVPFRQFLEEENLKSIQQDEGYGGGIIIGTKSTGIIITLSISESQQRRGVRWSGNHKRGRGT